MVSGTRWVEERIALPVRWIATGLLVVLATGWARWLWATPS